MKQFTSIILSCLLLLSSTGITYAQHFCGEYEMMAKITLGQEHLSCGIVMSLEDGCNDETPKDHNCCDNEYTQVHTDDTVTEASIDIKPHPVFVSSLITVFVLHKEIEYTTNTNYYKDYSPPPLGKDLLLLHQTFLI